MNLRAVAPKASLPVGGTFLRRVFYMCMKFNGIPRIPKNSHDEIDSSDSGSNKGIHMIEEQKMKPPAGFERLEAVQEAYEERAAILEFDTGMSREEAEKEARKLTGYEGW